MMEVLEAALEQMLGKVSDGESQVNKTLRSKTKLLVSALRSIKIAHAPNQIKRGNHAKTRNVQTG